MPALNGSADSAGLEHKRKSERKNSHESKSGNAGKSPLSQYLGIFLCVPVFILCGFEHSIADMYYFFLAKGISWVVSPSIGTILLYSLGNVLGALFLPLIQMGCSRLEKN